MKIALVGKARSGKDTVGNYLIDNYGFQRFYFAQGIEEIIKMYFPDSFVHGKPRKHYQHIGQELRMLDEQVWINFVDRKVNEYLTSNPKGNVLITDTRQFNEGKYLKENGYMLVKVECNDSIRLNRILESNEEVSLETFFHDTERQSDLIIPHLTIKNNGSLEDLYQASDLIIKYYNDLFLNKRGCIL